MSEVLKNMKEFDEAFERNTKLSPRFECKNTSTGETKTLMLPSHAKQFFKRGYNWCGGCGHRYYDTISAKPEPTCLCRWCVEEEDD